jgi:hypothetical protein
MAVSQYLHVIAISAAEILGAGLYLPSSPSFPSKDYETIS